MRFEVQHGRRAWIAGLVIAAAAALSFAPAGLRAQDGAAADSARPDSVRSTGAHPAGARPTAVAARRTGPIDVDGRLDEAAWRAASPATHFTQQEPDEGRRATHRTFVRFLYDDDALYIGARMADSAGAAGITARLARRDDDPMSDQLRIAFDPYHDRLHEVVFAVDPAGWRGDSNDGDDSWDPVWKASTSVDSAGWTAEIRIPFSQVQFSGDSVQVWGLEISRVVHRTQEKDLWSFYRKDQSGGPSFWGTLEGIRTGGSPAHAEVLPYVVTRGRSLGTADPASPFYDPHSADVRFGGDLRYLLNSSFSVSATVNPDFGQVELDPAVVNLSAFETYYSEKRPFFVQGSDVFDFGSPGCMINCGFGLDLFYSRRIGAPPQGAGLARSAGDWADIPDNTTILGAAKLTGRTEGGTTVGVLDAVTGHESARVATAPGSTFTQPVAPLTNDFVGRVKQDYDDGNLVVGGLFTSVDRRLTDPGLADLLPSSARAGGADVKYYWGGHDYFLYAALTGSHVTGDSAAMLRLQRSSARYLQRPDRSPTGDGLFTTAYDPGATSLSGYGGIFRVAKQGGTWLWDVNGAAVSPGYETNDLGFQRKADYLWLNGSLARQLTTPSGWYRSIIYGGGAQRYWSYEGDITQTDVTGATILELLNYWQFQVFVQRSLASYSDRLTRGGPVVRQPGSTMGQVEITSDPRQAVTLHAVGRLGRTDAGGFSRQLELTATWRPSPNVKVSLGPSYSHDVTTDQYVTSVADPTATAFYGRRYVFAHLDEKQLAMETRASITFTPSLSFELYLQPLIASAGFSQFEEFAAPRSEKKLVYGRDVGTIAPASAGGSGGGAGTGASAPSSGASPEAYTIDPDGAGPAASFDLPNPNFDRRSLRGTAVLRWQWRPGSTAYLVWTQTRNGRAPFGDLSLNRDLGALGSLPADNTLEVKISYWLGL